MAGSELGTELFVQSPGQDNRFVAWLGISKKSEDKINTNRSRPKTVVRTKDAAARSTRAAVSCLPYRCPCHMRRQYGKHHLSTHLSQTLLAALLADRSSHAPPQSRVRTTQPHISRVYNGALHLLAVTADPGDSSTHFKVRQRVKHYPHAVAL